MNANPHEHSTLSKIYSNNQLGSILNKEQTRQLRYNGSKDARDHWRFLLTETIAARHGELAAKLISETPITEAEWRGMSTEVASALVKLNQALYPELLALVDNTTAEGKTVMLSLIHI